MRTLGLIGAGHIGSQLARLAVLHGYDVVLANSRGPETLASLLSELGPKASAASAAAAAAAGELVVVSIPLKAYLSVPAAPLAGKIVVDTNNYYAQRDGHIAELDRHEATSAQLLQRHLSESKVVKAFNHIQAAHLTAHAQPAGSSERRALAVGGDDEGARAIVARLIDELGFDAVDAGPLAESWRIEPGSPGYGPRRTASELRDDLSRAVRPTAR